MPTKPTRRQPRAARSHARTRRRSPEKRRITVYRSSKTGRLVTADYARRHPATTERQRVRTDEPAQRRVPRTA